MVVTHSKQSALSNRKQLSNPSQRYFYIGPKEFLLSPSFLADLLSPPQPIRRPRSLLPTPFPPASALGFFFFSFSFQFIFCCPFLFPFQKVMHTRKRHSELYHELNHSSKFHTIDRYSRDPAMSSFKVRPPSIEGISVLTRPSTPYTPEFSREPQPVHLLTHNPRPNGVCPFV